MAVGGGWAEVARELELANSQVPGSVGTGSGSAATAALPTLRSHALSLEVQAHQTRQTCLTCHHMSDMCDVSEKLEPLATERGT